MSNEQPQPIVNSPELTVTDLANLRSIIEVATQRGAFRAVELAAVGTAYNKLNDFLNAVTPATPANTGENAVQSA